MSLVTELEKMILNPSSFVKRNEVNLSGNGRDSCNVFIIPESELLTFQDKLEEYVQYEQSHKVIIQEPQKSKKEMKRERGQRATAAIYDEAIDDSFYFPLGGIYD